MSTSSKSRPVDKRTQPLCSLGAYAFVDGQMALDISKNLSMQQSIQHGSEADWQVRCFLGRPRPCSPCLRVSPCASSVWWCQRERRRNAREKGEKFSRQPGAAMSPTTQCFFQSAHAPGHKSGARKHELYSRVYMILGSHAAHAIGVPFAFTISPVPCGVLGHRYLQATGPYPHSPLSSSGTGRRP
jgi:hypothetical protein